MSLEKSLYLMGKPRISPENKAQTRVSHRLFQVAAYCVKHHLNKRDDKGLTPNLLIDDKGLTLDLLMEEIYSADKTDASGDTTTGSRNLISQYVSELNREFASEYAGLNGWMERLSETRVDIGEFTSEARAVTNAAATAETARVFMRKAVPLMNGVFLPIEWKHTWVIEWRKEIDSRYAKALERAYTLLCDDSLEDRMEMFDKAKRYRTLVAGRDLSCALPTAEEIWEKLEQERRRQPPIVLLMERTLPQERIELPQGSEPKREDTSSQASAPLMLGGFTDTDTVLLGVVALLPGQAWVEVEAIASRFLTDDSTSKTWAEADLERLGVLKTYSGAVERAYLKNERDGRVCIEEFWKRFNHQRERVWRWLANYGGSHDSEIKTSFALCLHEFIRCCRDGVEMGVLRLWLDTPHFPATPERDRQNALIALEKAYEEESAQKDALLILKTWSETRKIPLLQATALLCGRGLAKRHPNEGRKILATILEKEGSLASYVGVGVKGYLKGDAETTFSVLSELSRWKRDMVWKDARGEEHSRDTEILRIFLMLMHEERATEPSLLLKHATESERVYRLCAELFSDAILNNTYKDEAWCEFSYWLDYAESDLHYMDTLKRVYRHNTVAQEHLKVYFELYRNEFKESYCAIVENEDIDVNTGRRDYLSD